MQHLARLDRFCARLNNGLAAMAVALAALLVGAGGGRELLGLDAPPFTMAAPAANEVFVPVAWGP